MNSGAIVFLVLVAGVTVLGFLAAGWGRADLTKFEEWALSGRRFGTVVSWFLLGGDLYTAYTFVAVPALIYGAGAIGFFAVPYATIAYPIVFVVLARFWEVSRARGYMTSADFIRDRFGSRSLEIAVAITGILAAMPYIALQLVGLRTVFFQLGGIFAYGTGAAALIVAFAVLAAYTWTSGLRAPALIAFVKDTLIYVAVIAAVIVIPAKLGGWAHIFAVSSAAFAAAPKPGHILLPPGLSFAYATMALGSACSLFLYPHSITSLLAAKSANVVRRNAALLPAYSLLLGLMALLGLCAVAAGFHLTDPNLAVPLLFATYFPDWFAGMANAAIAIGALVPAAIMAIGSANLFASNIFGEFSSTRAPGAIHVAKWLCMAMCAFGLIFVLAFPVKYAIYFQLLGGAWMLQIFPSFVLGLFTKRFHPAALLAGWATGMAAATWMAIATYTPATGMSPNVTLTVFGSSLTGFIAFYALIANAIALLLASIVINRRPLQTTPSG